MEENKSSNRRSFVRKLLGLGAAAGATSLLLAGDKNLLPLAQAGSGTSATINIDEVNYGVGTTELQSTTTSGAALKGYASAQSGYTWGLYGQSDSTSGIGVYGLAGASTGWTNAVWGESKSINGTGVYGRAFASSGASWGVTGQSQSTEGVGVMGLANASTGNTKGVYGESYSIDGRGVYGYVSNASGTTYGVYGESKSTQGIGIRGSATASTGNTKGVYGTCSSPAGTAVFGYAPGSEVGVYGQCGLAGGLGVFGEAYASTGSSCGVRGAVSSPSGTGVFGYGTASTGNTYGVYGESGSMDGKGVYGRAYASSGGALGVYGQSDSRSGTGVLGYASASTGSPIGVEGQTNCPGGVGVRGRVGNASAIPFVATSASGQTANLQEWRNYSETKLSVIDKAGKLGIGTSSPSFMLHIISGVTGPLTAASAPGAGPAPNSFICENLTSGNYKNQFTFKASGANKYSFGNDIAGTGGQNFFIWDEVAAQAVMYIDSSQRVGLGTLSPTEKLHVVGNVKAASFITGDVEFANGVKATEEGDGLAFVNSKGTKIAVLDSEGNLRIKGDVIKDPTL